MLYDKKWINADIVYLHGIAIQDRIINLTELLKKDTKKKSRKWFK